MVKTVLWTSPVLHSAEYFVLTPHPDGFRLDGTINLLLENQPTRIIYHIDCDRNWMTRQAEVQQSHPDGEKSLHLTVDNARNWYCDGLPITWATGLTDIDLSITPATNLLPIHQHDLPIGQSREVNCVWVQPPALTLATLPQRYTRIDSHHYAYSAPSLNFEATISVDDDGVIVQYGDLWNRPGNS